MLAASWERAPNAPNWPACWSAAATAVFGGAGTSQSTQTALHRHGGLPFRGVVHYCDHAASPANAATLCAEVLASLRVLDGRGSAGDGSGAARLWVVTRRAVPAGAPSERLNLAHAAVWGLGRSIALERPEVWGGLIDLDSRRDPQTSGAAAAELCRSDGENEIALRAGARLRPRLVAGAHATDAALASSAATGPT